MISLREEEIKNKVQGLARAKTMKTCNYGLIVISIVRSIVVCKSWFL